MVDFTQSVQISRPGATQSAAATVSARVIREENEFADDRHGMRRKLVLLLPGNASVQTGDAVTYSDRNYEVVGVRHCRDIGGTGHVIRIQIAG